VGSKPEKFSTSIEDLPEARETPVVELSDKDSLDLRIAPVVKQLGDHRVRMLAYNGSVPGPTLRVPEGAEVEVRITNEADHTDTVHWHGLRLENRYDGTHETQRPLEPGDSFTARVQFPDPGVYWYHPHLREDYGQEMGLYGGIIVEPADPDYWPPAHREIPLTLDDVLLEEGTIAPFVRSQPTHVAMGRFGDVFLVGGDPYFELDVDRGEVIRLLLINTANTRVFRVGLTGTRMKLVGGDSGRVETEEPVDDVLLGPSERAIVDALFEQPGEVSLEHRTPERHYELGRIRVGDRSADPGPTESFSMLRTNDEIRAERPRVERFLQKEPDKRISFIAEMEMGHGEMSDHTQSSAPQALDHGGDGIEWEDEMGEMNRMTTPANMRWKLVDQETGAVNEDIDWRFEVGDEVKIRLVNELAGDHPMHHPFHLHGAGRFLILARDGEPETNLVWKDTVLVPAGQTVDILFEITHPGRWMAHCHISEHAIGMTFSFDVVPAEPRGR
jgi:FtsP/CotA-like multicopper oxidase with cupredoxin domain